jgi:hypothetical protein
VRNVSNDYNCSWCTLFPEPFFTLTYFVTPLIFIDISGLSIPLGLAADIRQPVKFSENKKREILSCLNLD